MEELRREEGMRESISELGTLTHGHRIGQNSSDLMKISGNLGGGITKNSSLRKERKSPVDLKVEKAIEALKDFAKQAKEEKNWKKQYQEREKNFGESEVYSGGR